MLLIKLYTKYYYKKLESDEELQRKFLKKFKFAIHLLLENLQNFLKNYNFNSNESHTLNGFGVKDDL